MTHDHDPEGCGNGEPRGGFGGFLRSLLSGLPWHERAEANETLAVREASLRFTPPDAENGSELSRSRVWRLKGSQDLEPVDVTVGISDGAYTSVAPAAGAELAPGDMVAVGFAGSSARPSSKGPGISLGKK